MICCKKTLPLIILCLTCLFRVHVHAQEKNKQKISMKDSLDGAFDLSDFVIEANGFIPVPYIITEPALGGFGIALAPIFLKRRPPYQDSVDGRLETTPVKPDITGGFAGWTLNNTWLAAAFRSGTLIKSRIKYTIGGGYANVNLSYFRTLDATGEKEYKFNFKTVPVFLRTLKRLAFSHWYAGIQYLFLKTNLYYAGDLPSFVKPGEINSVVSQPGAVIELDNRDNVFTPDKGVKLHFDGNWSNQAFGSDYDFGKLNYYMFAYHPISKKLIGGLRVDGQQALGDPPFYLLPYISMRGIPAVRYQGKADLLTELEFRWDFWKRWSIMFFSGTGKAFDEWSDFGSSQWIVSGGTGFRYLIARKFKLRMGIDIARGPETWAYYIVFGSNWLK